MMPSPAEVSRAVRRVGRLNDLTFNLYAGDDSWTVVVLSYNYLVPPKRGLPVVARLRLGRAVLVVGLPQELPGYVYLTLESLKKGRASWDRGDGRAIDVRFVPTTPFAELQMARRLARAQGYKYEVRDILRLGTPQDEDSLSEIDFKYED